MEKILFPKSKITKGDLIDYYKKVWKRMAPHLKDHPLAMQRFPNGISGISFFQKNVPEYFPDYIDRVEIQKKGGGTSNYAVCNSQKTLLFLADQAAITIHLLLSTTKNLDHTDRVIFDLDPPSGASFSKVVKLAHSLHDALEEHSLVCFPMLTGSRGVHIVVPLKGRITTEEGQKFAKAVAEQLVAKHPSICTTAARKEKRGGKIYIDTGRNGPGQLAVAPYSVRAKEGAPIALPVSWEGLSRKGLRSDSFTIKDIDEILKKPDPWAAFSKTKNDLSQN